MRHMLPQLLTEVPDVRPAAGPQLRSANPFGAIITAITGAVSSVAGAVASGNDSRAQQEWARQQTLQADIAARSAADQRADVLRILKYVVPAGILALTIYLLLR